MSQEVSPTAVPHEDHIHFSAVNELSHGVVIGCHDYNLFLFSSHAVEIRNAHSCHKHLVVMFDVVIFSELRTLLSSIVNPLSSFFYLLSSICYLRSTILYLLSSPPIPYLPVPNKQRPFP